MSEGPVQALCQDELATVRRRLQGLNAILGKDEAELRNYIASFDRVIGSGPAVGQSAPCRGYMGLKLLCDVENMVQEFDKVDTKEAMETVNKDIAQAKKPIHALIAAVNATTLGLKKAVQLHSSSTADKKRGGQSGGQGTSSKKAKKSKADIFENLDAVPQVERMTEQEIQEIVADCQLVNNN